jgi:DNA polymerase/3'-5' exonuclease PolX
MTTKRPVPREEALRIAQGIEVLLRPACLRLEIAGSLRRGRAEVGDVELVAIPKTHREVVDLFGDRTHEVDELHDLVARLVDEGVFAARKDARGRLAFGRRYKRLTFPAEGGLQIDLFAVLPPASWGVLFLVRTGPAAFSHRLVTPRHLGGLMPMGYKVDAGALWEGGKRLECPEEQDVFDVFRAPWIAPEQRTDTVRLSVASKPGEDVRWAWYDGDARTGWWAVEPGQLEPQARRRSE